MKAISDSAQRQSAKKFVEYWTFQRGSEKGEDQQFWNSLLRDVLGVGDLDYVCCWYKKATDYCRGADGSSAYSKAVEGDGCTTMQERAGNGQYAAGGPPALRQTKCAFVSTNSICQGESVAAMWKPLFERAGVEIDFAHRTFRWDNEANEKAHVHCVIIGFHCGAAPRGTPPVASGDSPLSEGAGSLLKPPPPRGGWREAPSQ